jgi:diguanylate cyclase (GGDEF)-like protein
MLVVSVAVLPTSKQGSRRGVLILGSLLDEQRIATWSEQTRAAIELLPAEVSALPVPYLTAFDRLTGSRADVVFLEDELTQHAVALIRDISEQPLQVMSVALPRAITRLGEETIRLSLLMLLLAGSLIMLVTWLLLRKLMLAPVVRLTRHIQSLKNNSLSTDHLDTEERLQHAAQVLALKPFGPPDLQRRDEIGQLARAFEHMQENLLRSGRQIWRLAYQDSLTGLPNRRMFMELMRRALTGSHPGRHGFALLFLDLDNFTQINDTLGHDAGDELLQKVAGQLQSCVRHDNPDDHQDPAFRKDTIARLGGDEFVVLLSCIHGHEQATVVARRILDALAEPLVLQQQIVTIGVSIGITLCPIDGTDIDQLFKNADHAMYQAKQQGKNTYVHFTGNDADKIIAATADPVPPV